MEQHCLNSLGSNLRYSGFSGVDMEGASLWIVLFPVWAKAMLEISQFTWNIKQ